MSDIIHLLPDSVANQIAAGEVIQRPASVLKELMENSIDAGATYIQILIKDAGRTLIQVVDNGKGMSETDARMAFERHATSKITDAKDLFAIRTMGFRGEALASIAAVAQVELHTRRKDDELGICIEVASSEIVRQEAISCSIGTCFRVKNLFYNIPARRRFLKSDNVEKTHLLNEFYRVALVNSGISFSFVDGSEEIFQIASSNVKLRIENIFGKVSRKRWEQQLLPIEVSTDLIKIYGYVGKPEFAQKTAHQYFFVNGRYMRHPYFHKAVMNAYDKMLPAGENPNYFIYFDIDPQQIDINIHPTKTEIKFENEQAIFPILSATVKETLGKFNVVPSIDFNTEGAVDFPSIPNNVENIQPPKTSFNPEYNPFNKSNSYKRPVLDWEKLYQGFDKSEEFYARNEMEEKSSEQTFFNDEDSPLVLQGEYLQLKNRYILTAVKSGLMLIHQQRAHHRLMYDMYNRQIEQAKAASQQLLFPEHLYLDENERIILDQILPDLEKAGFIIKFSSQEYTVEGIPLNLEGVKIQNLIKDIIAKSNLEIHNPTFMIKELIISFLASSAALKSSQKLSIIEMNDLIERLFASSNPNYSPDGKKITTILEFEEIEKLFK